MSKVVIAGDASGTGTFTISAPNGNTDRTLVLPDEAGTVDTLQRAGNVLQVVSAAKTDTFSQAQSGNSISGTDVTGLTPSITPSSASNKILVTAHINLGHSSSSGTGDVDIGMVLNRSGSAIAIGDSAGSRSRITAMQHHTNVNGTQHMAMTFLDSPSTTSSITYSIRIFQGSGSTQTIYVNRDAGDGDAASSARCISTLTLMEIAG